MKKYLLCAIMSLFIFSCSNDLEENLPSEIPQSSGQKIQAVFGDTEYTFDNKEQLKAAVLKMEKNGQTLKNVKMPNGVSTRASANSVFTFDNGTDEVTYNIDEGELRGYDHVGPGVISTISGSFAGYETYSRPTWADHNSGWLNAIANIEGGDRSGCIILEQVGTGDWIYLNVIQKGSPRNNIFHCDGTRELYFKFSPAGGVLTSENIVSTINGARTKYTSYKGYVENKLYPNWASINGFGTSNLIIIVKPDPTLTRYSEPKYIAFSILQTGTNESINIWIEQAVRFPENVVSGRTF